MITFQHKLMSLVVLALVSVLALVGCNSGSPPTQILLQVAGQILLMQEGGNVGQGNVTVRLTPKDGGPAIDIPVAANGTFAQANVPAGDYEVALVGVPASIQVPDLPDINLDGTPNQQVDIPAIYVIPTPPNPPPSI
jgi:hypothetical protein